MERSVLVEMKKMSDDLGESFYFDVHITKDSATVQEYIDALNAFQETYMQSCLGCGNCCYTRVPLLSIDVWHYLREFPQLAQTEKPLHAFMSRYGEVVVAGETLDMQLAKKENGACIFLKEDDQACAGYSARGLACQTYFCLPESVLAKEIRSAVINQGIDELARAYLAEEGRDTSAYEKNAYWGKESYDTVLLKDILPQEIWQKAFCCP